MNKTYQIIRAKSIEELEAAVNALPEGWIPLGAPSYASSPNPAQHNAHGGWYLGCIYQPSK